MNRIEELLIELMSASDREYNEAISGMEESYDKHDYEQAIKAVYKLLRFLKTLYGERYANNAVRSFD